MSCNHTHNSLFEESSHDTYYDYGVYHKFLATLKPSSSCGCYPQPTRKNIINFCNPTTMTCKPTTTTTLKPTTTTRKPVTTVYPLTFKPTTKQPTSCAPVTTTKKVVTSCGPVTTKKVVTSCGPVTTKKVVTTTKKPVVTTTTKKPVVTTKKVVVTTTKKPVITTTTTTTTTTQGPSCDYAYVVKPDDTMFKIANERGTDLAMLQKLNPHIKNMDLIYPKQKVCIPRPIICTAKYTVKSGDTMNQIAQMFGTDLTTLQKMNPYISDINLIYPGQVLCVPTIISTATPTGTPTGTPTQGSCDSVYVVKSGDTMFNIANANGTDLVMLKKLNPDIKNMDLIYPDQKVCIPKPIICSAKYTVKSGDTMSKIAQMFGTDLTTLQRLNPYISDINLIYPGQQICVDKTISTATTTFNTTGTPSGTTTTFSPQNYIPICISKHIVKPGDTLNNIAKMYNTDLKTIQLLNPDIKDLNMIYPNQQICIPNSGATPVVTTITPSGTTTITPSGTTTFIPTGTTTKPPLKSCNTGSFTYVVRMGEKIEDIAKSMNVSVSDIAKANPDINMKNIFPGILCIPQPTTTTFIPTTTTKPPQKSCDAGSKTWTVAKGVTVDRIASAMKVSVSDIAKANPGVDLNNLYADQVLCIPTPPLPPPPRSCNAGLHKFTVGRDQTIDRIASSANVSVSDIAKANPGINLNNLSPGLVLCIPQGKPREQPPKKK